MNPEKSIFICDDLYEFKWIQEYLFSLDYDWCVGQNVKKTIFIPDEINDFGFTNTYYKIVIMLLKDKNNNPYFIYWDKVLENEDNKLIDFIKKDFEDGYGYKFIKVKNIMRINKINFLM